MAWSDAARAASLATRKARHKARAVIYKPGHTGLYLNDRFGMRGAGGYEGKTKEISRARMAKRLRAERARLRAAYGVRPQSQDVYVQGSRTRDFNTQYYTTSKKSISLGRKV